MEKINPKWLLDEYKNAIDASNIVSITDARGVIEYVNDKFCEISRFSEEELIGRQHNIIRHPDMSYQTSGRLTTKLPLNQTHL